MKKQIRLIINVDVDKDDVKSVIDCEGFNGEKPIQNTMELVGFLELIKQQELSKIYQKTHKKEI